MISPFSRYIARRARNREARDSADANVKALHHQKRLLLTDREILAADMAAADDTDVQHIKARLSRVTQDLAAIG